MKTWEMLKKLTENPKKRFKRADWENLYITADNFKIICDSNGNRYGIYDVMEDLDGGWEELPQEVTWQEAIEGYINGKTIKCIYDGNTYIQGSAYKFGVEIHKRFNGFDRGCFANGKWYIL